jgi:ribonuclease HI
MSCNFGEVLAVSMTDYIVMADGGSRGNPGAAAYGTVVLEVSTQKILIEKAGYLGIATNNWAEYNGLIAGLKLVAELNANATVEVRLDSKLVVEQMSGRWKIKHPDMQKLAVEASKLFEASKVTYKWIPREENSLADVLCNEALDAVAIGQTGQIERRY